MKDLFKNNIYHSFSSLLFVVRELCVSTKEKMESENEKSDIEVNEEIELCMVSIFIYIRDVCILIVVLIGL